LGKDTRYQHLKKDGVLVQLGDNVKVQQPLALSGNTGYSTRPHLHFYAFNNLDGNTRASIPVEFRTTVGTIEELKKDGVY